MLYDNLKHKTSILTGKGVSGVDLTPQGVHVVTSDGSSYSGDILIGADGIHSSVRTHMWKIAAIQQPGFFSSDENAAVHTTYCCIFGISNPAREFPRDQTNHVQSKGHCYLLSTGPGNAVYWFPFKKLDVPMRGFQDKILRYSDADRDALAEEHAEDLLSDTLTFGDLYRAKTTATLQALPEVIFKRWQYKRIMIMGDAAHKVRRNDMLALTVLNGSS
jgi:2-polyprenyl-6-methoxyphenol hydroxylase-like FAD-dependent oxidoreductase